MRDHSPVSIKEFNGLYDRGGVDNVPLDHFSSAVNLQYYSPVGFGTRDGVGTYPGKPRVLRSYTFVQETGSSILLLDDAGSIWDTANLTTAILTIATMTDFGFVPIAGRAYITPCDGNTGLENEHVYVYFGDPTVPARVVGATPPDNGAPPLFSAANSATAGNVEAGIHIFAVAFETDSGFLSKLGPIPLSQEAASVTAPGSKKVTLTHIPVSSDTFVIARRIVATAAIDPTLYTGNLEGYQFFFLPNGRIADNTTTTLDVSFFDSELLEDASHLIDIYNNIPAGVGLTTYRDRMVVWATFADPSIALVSFPGEPEAVDQVDGLIIIPLDGTSMTAAQEFRDALYCFKSTKTYLINDNGLTPSDWPVTVLDQGLGCSLHGVCTVLDSAGIDIDFMILANYIGLFLFTGAFSPDPLTWKIKDRWLSYDKTRFNKIQMVNDVILQRLYIVIPDGTMLMGDYSNGLDSKSIKWSPWTFNFYLTSLALIDNDTLVLAPRAVVT